MYMSVEIRSGNVRCDGIFENINALTWLWYRLNALIMMVKGGVAINIVTANGFDVDVR